MRLAVSEKEIEAILNENRLINSENQLHRFPVEGENALLEQVRLGKYREIEVIDFDELNIYMGMSTKSQFRKFEYITVASNTLCTRAAIEGGLPADEAYDISEAMLRRTENAKSVNELRDIMELTAVILARETYKSKHTKSSYVLEQCKNYISRNIFTRIYLQNIAKYVGMNPSYVSRLFSEKEGITIQRYIQREKVNTVCNMLTYSDYSIAEIAQYIGFQSQSSLTRVFKEWQGTTPLEYRNQNFQEHYTKTEK